MKNILVALDLGDHSLNVLQYALDFAEEYKSNLFIVHVYREIDRTSGLKNLDRILKKEYYNEIQRLLEKTIRPPEIEIFTKIIKGDRTTRIEHVANQLDAQLIITSTVGDDEDVKYSIGKMAGQLIRYTNHPLLLIPPTVSYHPYADVTFVLRRLNVQKSKTLELLQYIEDQFTPTVKLVHVVSNETKNITPSNDLLDVYKENMTEIEDNNIYNGLNKYLKENKTDLVVSVRRRRGFFEKMVTNSVLERKELELHSPILILQGHKQD